MRLLNNTLIVLAVLICLPMAHAKLELPLLFTDGAVLQRGEPTTIWGWAEPGEEVVVSLAGVERKTTACAEGKWEVEFPERPAGGPYAICVEGQAAQLKVWDVYYGDVWICSGQSNMEWILANSFRVEATLSEAQFFPQIRQFKVPKTWAESPQERLQGGQWEVYSEQTGRDFTAVGLFFALELARRSDVPIGLLNTSWGGSRIEPWMRADVLQMEGSSTEDVIAAKKAERDAQIAKIEARLGKLPKVDPGIKDGIALWAAPDLDDGSWESIHVPGLWEGYGYEGLDGVAWYRTVFTLSQEDLEKPVTLHLGQIDDSDDVWVNGTRIGGMMESYNVPRIYTVDADLLKAGNNSLVVRVIDTGGGGGIYGDPALLFVEVGKDSRDLTGDWKFRIGEVASDIKVEMQMNHVPTVLYNAMIAPLQRYPIKGALWYQGESNASHEDAFEYRNLFKDMITSWRAQWGLGDFPFFWVQLASFISGSDSAGASPWAVLRESQSAALELPATAQAVIIDIGAAHDIHPKNKHDVGYRLALAARNIAYGETDLAYSGPVYRAMTIDNGKVKITFDYATGGLLSSNGGNNLKGFEVCGPDGKFVPAEAVAQGDFVLVSAAEVQEPAQVRYAWASNPCDADLINAEGLPASPFRTE